MASSMPNRAIKISWEVQESLKMVDHGGLSERQFATPRVACFTFIVRHETCLTHDNLQKRGFTVCSRYLLCEEAVEFLHCAFTRHIWTMFPTIFGVHWVMPGCIKLPNTASTNNLNQILVLKNMYIWYRKTPVYDFL